MLNPRRLGPDPHKVCPKMGTHPNVSVKKLEISFYFRINGFQDQGAEMTNCKFKFSLYKIDRD